MRYININAPYEIGDRTLGNELISLMKDSSLAAVIGLDELFRQGQLIVADTYKAFLVYAVVAGVYLILTVLSSMVFKWLETLMTPGNKLVTLNKKYRIGKKHKFS